MSRSLLPVLLLAVLAACRPEERLARLERRYQPESEYLTRVAMTSRNTLLQGESGGELRPAADEMYQDLRTVQRLRLGPVEGGLVRMEIETLDYRLRQPGQQLRMDLDGCVGVALYDTTARSLTWRGLADTSWSAAGSPADSGWVVEPMSREDAAYYLASSMELLANALADTTRELLPGQQWRETRRQNTTLGVHKVAWQESRTVTLRALENGIAKLDVAVGMVPDPVASGPVVELDGGGSGRLEFDLRRRCTVLNVLDTSFSLLLDDGRQAWQARSETHLDIRTEVRPWPAQAPRK